MRYLFLIVLLMAVVACDSNGSNGTNTSAPNDGGNRNPSQPDLEITDITSRSGSNPDDVIINATVRNNGASFNEDFVVRCEYTCNGNANFFTVGVVRNGMGAGESQTLGGDTLLSLSTCSMSSFREFSCTADVDGFINETNESNNTRTENLNTGR